MLQDATLDGVLHRLGGLVQAVARVRVFEREQVTWNAILSDMLSLSLALKLMGSHVPTSFSASATTPLHCPLDLDDVRQCRCPHSISAESVCDLSWKHFATHNIFQIPNCYPPNSTTP